jgi:hypothetical protein
MYRDTATASGSSIAEIDTANQSSKLRRAISVTSSGKTSFVTCSIKSPIKVLYEGTFDFSY